MTWALNKRTRKNGDNRNPIFRKGKEFRSDARGNMAMVWALSLMGLSFTVGASYDLTQVSKAKAIAQVVADNMALAASIAVDQDNDTRYVEGQAYSYDDLGGPLNDFTGTISGTVEYDVDEDGDGEGDLLARSTVTGTYQTAFMSLAPWIDGIPFKAVSDVAYAQTATTPASVLLILDNSGSMAWDDDNGENKIEKLRTSVTSFMGTLEQLTANADPRMLRTGLLSYSSQDLYVYTGETEEVCFTIGRGRRRFEYCYDQYVTVQATDHNAIFFNNKVNLDWGTVPTDNIDAMYASGGTDPFGSLKKGKQWMQHEDAIHEEENGEDEPLKFIIFMTDGSNSSNSITNSSLGKCNALRNTGTIVYTIGYDLEAGYQYEDGSYTGYYVSQNSVNKAKDFLERCAYDSDHYILASDADDLDTIFQQIGQEIVNEVIRIKR